MDATATSSVHASAPAGSYHVEARVTGPGVANGQAKGRAIEFDTSRAGSDELPGPAELLILAFAACLLKNVERFSHLLSFDYDGASVSIEAERQESPPRFTKIRYELRVATRESEHRVELLHRNLRRSGTVYNTLAETCDVDGTIVAGPDVTDTFERPPVDVFRSQVCC